MLKLSLKIFYSFISQKKISFFLISIGMFITIFGFTFIFSRGLMVYEEEASHYCETKTITITTTQDIPSETGKKLYSFLFNHKITPEIKQIMTFDKGTETIGHYSIGKLNIGIPYGRYFNTEELNGEKVVLLSDAYLSRVDTSFLTKMINSTIQIKNFSDNYKVIGRYNLTLKTDALYSNEVIIPLKTYIYNKFPLNNLEIIFAKKPKKQYIHSLENFLLTNQIYYSIYLPNKIEKQALMAFLKETISHFIILMICFITLLNLLRYWIKSNYRTFYIYYMCGCSSKNILFLLLLNTCYLYLVPAVLSLLFYKWIEFYFSAYGFITILTLMHFICIFIFAFISALLTTWKVAIRQLKKFNEVKEILP